MNREEALVREYLVSLGYTDIVPEPEGYAKPPDYSIKNSCIAVEVRRLNQNYNGMGIETLQHTIIDIVNNLLPEYGPAKNGKSWFVYCRILRKFGDVDNRRGKDIRNACKKVLDDFAAKPFHEEERVVVIPGLELEFWLAGKQFPHFFVFAGFHDLEAGGWRLPVIFENAQLCIDEKTKKASDIRNKYAEWWLLLVDTTSAALGGISQDDQAFVRRQLRKPSCWSKIIIVEPNDFSHSFEI